MMEKLSFLELAVKVHDVAGTPMQQPNLIPILKVGSKNRIFVSKYTFLKIDIKWVSEL